MRLDCLTFIQEAPDVYTAHYDGVGAVFWIHRSDVWGGRWQAFTEGTGKREAVSRARRYRADVFDAVRAHWEHSDPRNPLLASGGTD